MLPFLCMSINRRIETEELIITIIQILVPLVSIILCLVSKHKN